MRKILLTAVMICILAPVAFAGDMTTVAVVDVPKIIRECEAGKAAREKLKSNFQGVKEDLERQKAEINKLREELQKQSLVLSQEAKLDKEVEFKRKVRDYQDSMQSFRRKFKTEEKRASQPVVKLIVAEIQKYGKDKGYAMIIDGKAGGIMYADDKVNITNEIIVQVNRAWRASK